MGFLEVFFRIHMKYVAIYLITIPLMIASFIIGIIMMIAINFNAESNTLGTNVANIIFGIISSSPLIFTNYKVSIFYKDSISNFQRILLIILCQFISFVMYYVLFWLVVYLFF